MTQNGHNVYTDQADREEAAAHDRAANESFERCDTDGYATQWAHGVNAQKARMQADIAERGGWVFPALFNLDGELVPAKWSSGQFGDFFGLLRTADPRSAFVGSFNPSRARTTTVKARARDAKKGYYVGYVLAPAKAELAGGGQGMGGAAGVYAVARRTDGGFSPDVKILDNGVGATDVHRWYDINDGANLSAYTLA